jgi:hypothetical protein
VKEKPMTVEGMVSLWLGNAGTKDAFSEVLRVEFSEDGDFLGSKFSRGFGVGYYDEGLKESAYRGLACHDLSDLLTGVSYADVIIPRLQGIIREKPKANCFVLLYDQEHNGPETWTGDGVSLTFAGAVSYR